MATKRSAVGERAELRVDVAVVGDVVAAVGERRRVPGTHPDRVDTELGEVRQPVDDAVHVAGAVTVGVGERSWIDLVDDGAAPPLGIIGERHADTIENTGASPAPFYRRSPVQAGGRASCLTARWSTRGWVAGPDSSIRVTPSVELTWRYCSSSITIGCGRSARV